MNDQDRIQILADELFFVMKGIAQGNIKSQPIVDMSDENAESYEPITLAEHVELALVRAGVNLIDLAKKRKKQTA